MKNYGETFRTIREQKGYTMKQVSQWNCVDFIFVKI